MVIDEAVFATESRNPQATRHGPLARSKDRAQQQPWRMPPHTVGKQGREITPERNKQRRQREQAGPLPGSSPPYRVPDEMAKVELRR